MFKWRSLRGGCVIWMKNSEWCSKLVPKMRWSMSKGSMSDFEWWWWFDESDIRWRACVGPWGGWIDTRSYRYADWVVLRICFVSERDDFIFNSFSYERTFSYIMCIFKYSSGFNRGSARPKGCFLSGTVQHYYYYYYYYYCTLFHFQVYFILNFQLF